MHTAHCTVYSVEGAASGFPSNISEAADIKSVSVMGAVGTTCLEGRGHRLTLSVTAPIEKLETPTQGHIAN